MNFAMLDCISCLSISLVAQDAEDIYGRELKKSNVLVRKLEMSNVWYPESSGVNRQLCSMKGRPG